MSSAGRREEEADGKRGIEMCREKSDSYCAIFCDLAMPEMDGYTVARGIRQLPGYDIVPLITTTASVTQEVREKAKQSGFSMFLTKPISIRDLEKAFLEFSIPFSGDAMKDPQ